MAQNQFVPSVSQLERNAAFGAQGPIIIAAVPAAGNAALVGTALVDAGQLTVLGLYRCLIPMSGMVSAVKLYLKATFASGTVTTDVDSLFWVRDPNLVSAWSKLTAATGDGAMTTTVLQTVSITPAGEQYAVLDFTLATAAACTFTQAEYMGL